MRMYPLQKEVSQSVRKAVRIDEGAAFPKFNHLGAKTLIQLSSPEGGSHWRGALLFRNSAISAGGQLSSREGGARWPGVLSKVSRSSRHQKGVCTDEGHCFPRFGHLGTKVQGALVTGRGFALTRGTALPKFCLFGAKLPGALVTGRGFALTRGTAFPTVAVSRPTFGELSSLEGGSHWRGLLLYQNSACWAKCRLSLPEGGSYWRGAPGFTSRELSSPEGGSYWRGLLLYQNSACWASFSDSHHRKGVRTDEGYRFSDCSCIRADMWRIALTSFTKTQLVGQSPSSRHRKGVRTDQAHGFSETRRNWGPKFQKPKRLVLTKPLWEIRKAASATLNCLKIAEFCEPFPVTRGPRILA